MDRHHGTSAGQKRSRPCKHNQMRDQGELRTQIARLFVERKPVSWGGHKDEEKRNRECSDVLADKLGYRAFFVCLRRAAIAGGISRAVTPFFLQMVQTNQRTLQHQAERPPPRLKPGGFSPSSMTSSPVAPWTIHSDASPQRDCRS